MLVCEGYKMFRGTMKITPKGNFKEELITGDWLYKPNYDTWYCKGRSYSANICEIIDDLTK